MADPNQPLQPGGERRGEVVPLQRLALSRARRDWPVLRGEQTVGQALEDLRHSSVPEGVVCFFVADALGRLSGVVPVGRLLGAARGASVTSIMLRNVVSLPRGATVETAADALLRHDLLALPIVDEGSRLIGVVDVGMLVEDWRRRLSPDARP